VKIGELNRRSGVSMRSLRYYEEQGLLTARRESNGYRDYDDSAVQRAATIHMLFGMDFPREVVRSVLACIGQAPSDASHDRLAEQLEPVRIGLEQRIEQLTTTYQSVNEFLQSSSDKP
jgi:DNA-binding transcriptional MerR regulator